MSIPSPDGQGTTTADDLLNSPLFRPSFRFGTAGYTLWQDRTGPQIQLELLQPSFPLVRSNLAVLCDGIAKRDLPVKLFLKPDKSNVLERPEGIGLLRLENADAV